MAYSTRTLRELSRVIFSRLLGIILILMIVVAGALVTTFFLTPWQYRSEAMLLADPTDMAISPLDAPASRRDRLSLFILRQREIINTGYVNASALMKLDGIEPMSDGPMDLSEKTQWYSDKQITEFTAKNSKRLNDVRKRVKVTTPGGVDISFTQTFNIIVDWPEEKDLSTDGKTDSRTLATQRAQQFTKHLIDAYQFRRSSLEAQQAKEDSVVRMKHATDLAKTNREKAQEARKQYIADELKSDFVLVQNMLKGYGETGLQTQRTEAKKEIGAIDARLAELAAMNEQIDKELKKGSGEQVVIPAVLLKDNLALAKIIGSIADLRIELNTLTPQFEDSYKGIKEVRAGLVANLVELKNELTRQRTMLNMEIAAKQGERIALDKIVTQAEENITKLGPKVAEYSRLDRDVDDAQKMYSKRLEGLQNAENAEAAAKIPGRVKVIDGPSLPNVSEPHRPILWANVLISIFAGLVLALVYAFMADHFDHTVKGIDDVERHIETNVLASVPKFTHKIIRTR